MPDKKKKTNKKNANNKIWKTVGGNVIIWVLIIVMSVTALQLFSTDKKPKQITYSEFKDFLDAGKIDSAEILETEENVISYLLPESEMRVGLNTLHAAYT